MHIKDIPIGDPIWIKYNNLDANIFEESIFFCARSYDAKWCCTGIVLEHLHNKDNPNPMLQVNAVYKRVEAPKPGECIGDTIND